ncbi:MAG: M4 family metallopeptidase [Thermoanaerobaculia bacterium]
MRRFTALLIGVLICLHPDLSASGRDSLTAEREAVARLSQDSVEPLVAHRKPTSAAPFFVQGRVPLSKFTAARAAEERGRDFFRRYGAVFGIRDEAAQLKLKSATPDAIGMTHVRYDQVHGGLPVFGRQLVVHFDQFAVTAVNGDFADVERVPTTPAVSSREARDAAVAVVRKREAIAPALAPELLVHVDGAGHARLAWQVSIATRRPVGFWRVFVDALDGKVFFSYDDLKTARNRMTYTNGNNPLCNDFGAPLCTLPGTIQRTEPQGPVGNGPTDAAHDNAGIVYDYFMNTFGRDSYDGSGHTIRSTTHFGDEFVNAFWCNDACAASFGSSPDGEQMAYGDGDGVEAGPLSQALDIVAHELTHAVTDGTAGLQYFGQSGALNESYSDVFAIMVDTADFQLGEDVWTPGTPGDALRDMQDPTPNNQPGHVTTFFYGLADSAGVHINSGIPNKAAYLAITAPGYGIGRPNTQQIYYRALINYLTPTSDFLANLNALLQASTDLFGAGSAQTAAIRKSQAAVGVANSPTVVSPNGGETLTLGAPASITWTSPGDAGIGYQVDALRDLGSITSVQGFEGGPSLPPGFTTSAHQPWGTDTILPGAGTRSARSGAVTDRQRSVLGFTATMTAPGIVSFLVKVSSEQNFDFFSFWIDGVPIAQGSGEIPWGTFTTGSPVPAGTHHFVFVYEKDSELSSGLDAAWIDNLTIPNSENVTFASINAATAGGATSQPWTPNIAGTNYRIRVTLPGIAPWFGFDRSNAVFSVAGPPLASSFYTLAPCRIADTRDPNGSYGGPALDAGIPRTFTLASRCAIPATAKAVSLNVTITGPTSLGHLSIYPGGTSLPIVSTMNFRPGQTRANNAIIQLGAGGTLSTVSGQAGGTVHLLLDVNGYFE